MKLLFADKLEAEMFLRTIHAHGWRHFNDVPIEQRLENYNESSCIVWSINNRENKTYQWVDKSYGGWESFSFSKMKKLLGLDNTLWFDDVKVECCQDKVVLSGRAAFVDFSHEELDKIHEISLRVRNS